jgi:trk system potassium uptake protein TrkA
VVGREVGSLRLPEDVHIGLIVRGLPDELAETQADEAAQHEPEVIFPRTDTVLQSNDHVVFFLPHKRLVAEVEQLFRVGATFF